MNDVDKLKKTAELIQELGHDWRANSELITDAIGGNRAALETTKRLFKNNSHIDLVKIGLAFLAFPLPIVIDDVVGCSLVAAGLVQKKMQHSTAYLEDIRDTFSQVVNELQNMRSTLCDPKYEFTHTGKNKLYNSQTLRIFEKEIEHTRSEKKASLR